MFDDVKNELEKRGYTVKTRKHVEFNRVIFELNGVEVVVNRDILEDAGTSEMVMCIESLYRQNRE